MNSEENAKQELGNEIFNELCGLLYILETKRSITNKRIKNILGEFLVFFTPIFICGLEVEKFVKLKQTASISSEELKNIRHKHSHFSHLQNGINNSYHQRKISEMGIDFENYVIDIILTKLNGKLLYGFNYGTWQYQNSFRVRKLGEIVNSLNTIACRMLPETTDIIKCIINHFRIPNNFDEIKISYRSHSTNRLFQKSVLSVSEKLCILETYGVIRNILLVSHTMNIPISIELFGTKIEIWKFFIKAKAIIISSLGDIRNRIELIDNIGAWGNENLPENFFKINRRCRDNLHKKEVNVLSNEEYILLVQNQDKYLEKVLNIYDSHINI